MDRVAIGAAGVRAEVAAAGAELVSLRDGAGRELLWQAGPAWPRHAPVLFPIVGQLAGNRYRLGGREFTLPRHGFARDQVFTCLSAGPGECLFRLTETPATLAAYPFPFRLDIAFAARNNTLTTTCTVTNTGAGVLPFSLGLHPAFRWPLAKGVAKEAHVLTFTADEPDPIHRAPTGLLSAGVEDSPVRDRCLPLSPRLFDRDALVFTTLRSRGVTLAVPDRADLPRLTLAWDGFPHLGLWSNGGDFLCIEPWHGHADPEGFASDFREKPGLIHLPPGDSRVFSLAITVE
ncbi:MAG: hypothetical protein RLY86_1636 [Pseudomonadota bacterium]|jgi:galactose mutarotase-like enzyme